MNVSRHNNTITHDTRHTHTCAALADHHTQVDGRPVGTGRAAVGTASVARLCPDSLSHLAIGQSLSYGGAHGLDPLLLELLRLHREAVGRPKESEHWCCRGALADAGQNEYRW